MKMKRYLTFLIISLFSLVSFADDVTFEAQAPSAVEEGGRFRVQFIVNTLDVSNFQAPDFSGFEVLYGPSTSTSSSYQIINGRTTQSCSIAYVYTVLASRAGTFKINSATIQANGKTLKSKPFTIKVLPAGQGGQSSSRSSGGTSGRQQNVPVTTSSNITSDQLFMNATASRTKVNEQEAILLTYKLYTQVNVTSIDGKFPTLDGFQVQDVSPSNNRQEDIEEYNGRNYHTVIWTQYVLFPQKSGDLVIPSITYEALIQQQKRNMTIDDFFNGRSGIIEVKKKISTPKITIHVSPLPSKPSNFSGAVGKFSISSSCSPLEIVANDAVTLRLNVKGTGNMKLINAPKADLPKDFEVYDPKVNDKFNITKSGFSGTKEFEYLFVPRHAGQYKIPSIDFVYFDTESRTYKTLKTEEYTINVKKGAGSTARAVNDYSSQKQDVEQLDQDIRFIKTGNVKLVKQGEQFFGTFGYMMCYIVPLLIFILALILGRRQLKENANVAKSRGKKANKMAVKRLKNAGKLLKTQKQSEFYDEVMRALWGYIADKLNMPMENLNKDNVLSELSSRNVSTEASEMFIKSLNDCEFARYAPGDAASNMQAVYDSAVDAISKMEDNL